MNEPIEYFDAAFYLAQLDSQQILGDPFDHYCTIGCKAGLSPSPYFDITWYKVNHADLDDYDGNVLAHYLDATKNKHVDAHPAFRAAWYWEKYLSETNPTEDPLLHYTTIGWVEGNQPSPLFWNDYYAKTYLGVERGNVDPFLHYILGGKEENSPNPLFDVEYYITRLDRPADPDPLSHYLHVGWRAGLSCHPLFDPRYYLASKNLRQSDINRSPIELFLEDETQPDPHILFSNDHYRKQLRAAGLEIEPGKLPVLNYLERGCRDLCDPHAFFCKKHYYEHAPDVYATETDALTHFLLSGYLEGRRFHPLFAQDDYRSRAGIEGDVNALIHYLTYGSKNGIDCRSREHPDQETRSLPTSRNVIEIPNDEVIFSTEKRDAKTGAFFHIFYPELAEEMLLAANNIPGSCTVYISTDSVIKERSIRKVCREVLDHPFEIRVLPNRGRDIAPMIVGFADRLREVDYGVHLHSKRSKHYKSEFENWRHYLSNGNLGSREQIQNILGLLERPDVGAVAPEHYYPIRSLIQWGGNFGMISSLLSLMGEELHRDCTLDFPSGSMFWFKTDAISALLDIGLDFDHFDAEAGQVDGTLAHAIERGFFYFVEAAGFEYVTIDPKPSNQIKTRVSDSTKTSFLANRYFVSDVAKGPMRKHYPETTRFMVRPSKIEKPRFNIMIPTVDTGNAYAGVATALDVYASIRSELGDDFDGRMISTDMSPSNQFCPPDGYEVRSAVDEDVEGVDSVVDAARRFHSPFFVRKNDIFLSTAWWTATNGFEIAQKQAEFFDTDAHPLAYLIQDDETGFYAWSTRYALADATYRKPEQTIPIFNTELLFEDFKARGLYNRGHALQPGINRHFKSAIVEGCPKEKIVLLYARPHAERNCLVFLDALIDECVSLNAKFWDDWRFIAIGEDFEVSQLKTRHIEVLGRLTLDEYAEISSRAALAISLMVSPHPSYPPLEMAEAGVSVLTNVYHEKDLSKLHDNISSFAEFSLQTVSAQLFENAQKWMAAPESGWQGQPKVDWFFGGHSNMDQIATNVADEIRKLIK